MAVDKLGTFNDSAWIDWFSIFQELALSAFSYDNLPPEINSRFLEKALFENGAAAFFRDDDLGKFVVTKFTQAGTPNVYDEPTDIHCIGGGGGYYQKMMKNGINAVVIFNNFTRSKPATRLTAYAKRIQEIENTIDINVNAQKTPYIITGDRKTILSMKKIYQQIGEFQPAIFLDEQLAEKDSIKVLTTNAPFVVDKLEDEKRKLYNEALSFLGIDNNASEKSERLLVDEIMVSNGFAIANRNARLQMRELCVEKINNMFGLNISVKFNNPSFFNSPYDERRANYAAQVDGEGTEGNGPGNGGNNNG